MALYKSLVRKISIPADKKTKRKEYEEVGALAIIDQGKKLIGGYTNNLDMQLKCTLPVIIFGDHTRAVKYVDFPFGAGADGIKVLSPKNEVNPKYLFYGTQYLTLRFPDKGYARHYQYIEKMDLRLPGLEEQLHIVTYIEELFSELDKSVETLQTIKKQLEVYRQAVLKEAFDLSGTESIHIKDVCKDIKVGIVIKPTQYYVSENGIRALRNANVRRGYIDDTDWVLISEEGHQLNNRSEVHTNDVLISRSGANLGMASVVSAKYDGYNAIDIVIAVPDPTKIIPEYLAQYTNSPMGRTGVKKNERGGAQGHLNVSAYAQLPISVPKLEEQMNIIKILSEKLSVCDSIEQTVDTALSQAEAMRQSILKKAFEGGLSG